MAVQYIPWHYSAVRYICTSPLWQYSTYPDITVPYDTSARHHYGSTVHTLTLQFRTIHLHIFTTAVQYTPWHYSAVRYICTSSLRQHSTHPDITVPYDTSARHHYGSRVHTLTLQCRTIHLYVITTAVEYTPWHCSAVRYICTSSLRQYSTHPDITVPYDTSAHHHYGSRVHTLTLQCRTIHLHVVTTAVQ